MGRGIPSLCLGAEVGIARIPGVLVGEKKTNSQLLFLLWELS